MEEKKKVTREQIKEQITSIANAVETMRLAIEEMPEGTAKKSFTTSYINLKKKVDDYQRERAERFRLSDEEKEYIIKMRAEKEGNISEIPTNDNNSPSEGGVKKKGNRGNKHE